MKKFLIALPSFKGSKGFNHPTILLSAENKTEAIKKALRIKGENINIGDIKKVNY